MGFIMKQRHIILSAAIAAALANAPGTLLAQSKATLSSAELVAIGTTEAPRVTQAVSNSRLVTIANTHLAFVDQATSSTPLDESITMQHMQLVLKPSAQRETSLQALIASQHDPASPQFHHWMTPQQFGEAFGVVDSDIAAVASWLSAQGFTVNNVYPNKAQIDFTGTVAQVNQAFHTQENIYTVGNVKHFANAGDISVPSALQPVIAGVMGVNDVRPKAQLEKPRTGTWNAATHKFAVAPDSRPPLPAGAPEALQGLSIRGLVPYDLMQMYGITQLRANGVTGSGITIAVVESYDMVATDWTNFVSQFDLGSFGGTFQQTNPQPTAGPANCYDPDAVISGLLGIPVQQDEAEALLDAEWSTAIAPGANIEVASCYSQTPTFAPATTNFFGGMFIAATNLINADTRPDVISASYGWGEKQIDSASKTAIDLMWAQADAEGISVFVAAGDSGSNPSYNGFVIYGHGVDANGLATSPNVTGVGGTDTADVLDGTTSQYFSGTPNSVYGTALGYVPEIPWNASCGNAVAAKDLFGYSSALDLCKLMLKVDPDGYYVTSEAGSGGPSSVDIKPAWQRLVTGAAADDSRDLPDVALFAGSYGPYTAVIICTKADPCTSGFTTEVSLAEGTSLASPMFAGIQALMDQGIASRGLSADQGNAAPTLYALAGEEYGTGTGHKPSTLAACSADNGEKGTAHCVFHNITRGGNSTQCVSFLSGSAGYEYQSRNGVIPTPNCYYYGTTNVTLDGFLALGAGSVGLTSAETTATSYTKSNEAYSAQAGWSFASGLGSVNTTNLLNAWLTFIHAPAAAPGG
jgi:subtilase family serine protease